ncbi:MAG TPA: RNA 2',3'-cyclic phosphodiesterase [Pyrinomonadaceae bacterium]|nr:RNA 2',3'-cyclic phosphodiesterase [Pyrinomonadaceae bacterium]
MSQTQNLLRLFAAVELTDAARRSAVAHVARLRTMLSPVVKVGWEREEKLHLTLKFFGGVEPERLPGLSDALALAAASARPFSLSLEQAGVFPTPARPSVLWLGLADPSGELARLQLRLEDECAAANFPREQKPFRPHVTLARVRTATRETRSLARQHLELAFEPVTFGVSEIVLVSSRLGPGGSVHTPLSRHRLEAGTGRTHD